MALLCTLAQAAYLTSLAGTASQSQTANYSHLKNSKGKVKKNEKKFSLGQTPLAPRMFGSAAAPLGAN